MATSPGGRGRSGIAQTLPQHQQWELDAGQHILIGAYTESLRLIQRLGVDPDQAFWRAPLALVGATRLAAAAVVALIPADHADPRIRSLRAMARKIVVEQKAELEIAAIDAGSER